MIIKDGYNGEPTKIKINHSDGRLEVWIEQATIPNSNTDTEETLAHADANEMFELLSEVKSALRGAIDDN